MAAPVYQSTAVAGTGSGTYSATYTASNAAGDAILCGHTYKYPGITPTISHFPTLFSSAGVHRGGFLGYSNTTGLGTGVDLGDVGIAVAYMLSDGSESGVDVAGAVGSTSAYGRMFRVTKTSGKRFAFGVAVGLMNAGSTSFSVTFATDPGITNNDLVMVFVGLNSDTSACSAQSLSIPGCTVTTQTERDDAGTSTGDDIRQMVSTHTITAGTSSGAATFTMTTSAATSGAAVLVRIREADADGAFAISGALTADFKSDYTSGAAPAARAPSSPMVQSTSSGLLLPRRMVSSLLRVPRFGR